MTKICIFFLFSNLIFLILVFLMFLYHSFHQISYLISVNHFFYFLLLLIACPCHTFLPLFMSIVHGVCGHVKAGTGQPVTRHLFIGQPGTALPGTGQNFTGQKFHRALGYQAPGKQACDSRYQSPVTGQPVTGQFAVITRHRVQSPVTGQPVTSTSQLTRHRSSGINRSALNTG